MNRITPCSARCYTINKIKHIYRCNMPLKTKGFRLDEALIQELATKAESMNMSESEIVRKALVCFLGIKFDNDCASYDELQTVKQKLDKVIQFLNIDI